MRAAVLVHTGLGVVRPALSSMNQQYAANSNKAVVNARMAAFGIRPAAGKIGASVAGARATTAARIANASESLPVFHHDEESRMDRSRISAMQPSTAMGNSQ